MAQRRDRPPVQRSGSTIDVRLPDGTVRSMPVDNPRGPAVCCFCGQTVEQSDRNCIQLSARWIDGGREQTQIWDAHRDCLAERMHEAVAGSGPFFGE